MAHRYQFAVDHASGYTGGRKQGIPLKRDRRLHTASEAKALGRGGIAAVSLATGVARSTIGRGLKDLASPERFANGRVRREGGGRKPLTETDPTLICDLEALVEPYGARRPTVAVALDLQERARSGGGADGSAPGQPHQSHPTAAGEWLQPARQPQDRGRGRSSRSRRAVPAYQPRRQGAGRGEPVISVDTKKKELIGNYQNQGRQWRPKRDSRMCASASFGQLPSHRRVDLLHDHRNRTESLLRTRPQSLPQGRRRHRRPDGLSQSPQGRFPRRTELHIKPRPNRNEPVVS